MPWRGATQPGEAPTLGFEIIDWIEANCVIPDGDYQGEPFILSPAQRDFVLAMYELHPDADQRIATDARQRPNRAFTHTRGGLLVAPQKWGKGPFAAAIICAEAYGPVRFDGWNAAGEPAGRPWKTPLIAVTAQSEKQGQNIWDSLLWMIKLGPLIEEFQIESGDRDAVGLSRINLPNGGRIDPVTSSAKSRQGARITFAAQDEVQSWLDTASGATGGGTKLADTQYRSLAGMGGRFLQTCNAWDPAEHSVAQDTWDKGLNVVKLMIEGGPGSIRNRAKRLRVLKRLYKDAPWVDPNDISDTIDDFIARGDVAQAERFFFNRIVPSEDRAVEPEKWQACKVDRKDVGAEKACAAHTRDNSFHALSCGRAAITIGVDGARYVDALAIIGTEIETGYQWPIGIWERPENARDDYEHPLEEIDGAMIEAFDRFNVWRAYVDPGSAAGDISVLTDRWAGRWSEKRIIEWLMSRPRAAALMVRAYVTAIVAGDVKHPGDPILDKHVENARRLVRQTMRDENGVQLWLAAKDFPGSKNKMDGFAAAALSWQARGDAVAAGVLQTRSSAYSDLCRCNRTPGPPGGGPHLWNSRTCPADPVQ